MSDEELKKKMFRRTLWLLLGLFAISYVIQFFLSYDMTTRHRLKYGSYGIYLARLQEKNADQKRIICFGNSVYQGHEIIPRFRIMAEKEKRQLQFINFAQVGSGISDNVIQIAHCVNRYEKPELFVISMATGTFLDLGSNFNTDSRVIAFQRGIMGQVPGDFYQRKFTAQQMIDLAVTQYLPLRRIDPILKKKAAKSFVPDFLQNHIYFPSLNTGYFQADERPDKSRAEAIQGDFQKTLDDLIHVLKKADVPVLIIRQERNPSRFSDLVKDYFDKIAAENDLIYFVDLEHFYQKENFGDFIHPKLKERDAYAERHYQAILRTLESHYGKKDSP